MKKIKVVEPERWTQKITKSATYYLPEDCKGGIVIDCGSNVGDFEINHKNRFDKYVCFDILDENIEIMKKNLSEFNLNYVVEKKACYNEGCKTIPVYAHQDSEGNLNYFGNSGNVSILLVKNQSLNKWGWYEENKIDDVETISIDEIIEKYGDIKLLKFDIEGSEFEFLLEKDLSRIEFITGEIHFEEEKQKILVDFISKTHQLIKYNHNHIYSFKRK